MRTFEEAPELKEDAEYVESMRGIIVDAYREVEPYVPLAVARELDEDGTEVYVSRPMLPVAYMVEHRKEVAETEPSIRSVSVVIEAVSQVTGFPKEVVTGPIQSQKVVRARHAAMYLARTMVEPEPSYPKLGIIFDKNHTSVMSAVKGIETLLQSYEPRAAKKKDDMLAIIDDATAIIAEKQLAEEQFIDIEIKKLVCMCMKGLVAGPLIELPDPRLLTGKRRAAESPLALDWENSAQSPEIYRRFGDAALSLARNVLTSSKR